MNIKAHQIEFNSLNWISIILIFLSISCQSGSIQNDINTPCQNVLKKDLNIISSEGLAYYANIPFTGEAQNYYPDSTLAETISYLRGIRHGTHKKWFNNGVLSYEAQYQNGILEGKIKSWWPTGKIRSESLFIKGVPNGTQKQWYRSGHIFKEINLVNGQEEGMQKAWRENGKLYSNYEAKNGRIFGLKRSTLCYELKDGEIQYNSK